MRLLRRFLRDVPFFMRLLLLAEIAEKLVIDFNVVQNRKKSTTSKQTKTQKCRWKSFKRTKVVECAMLGYFILVSPLSLGSCKLHTKAMPTRRKYVEGRS